MSEFDRRSTEPELLDGDTVAPADRLQAIAQLPFVNRYLGGTRALLHELAPVLPVAAPAGRRWRLLDVGCGSADMAEAIVRRAFRHGAAVLALDRDPAALRLASERAARSPGGALVLLRGDALRLPLADQSCDVVTANMVCHHFFGDSLVRLVAELTRVARDAVIINDLHRHRLAAWGWRLVSRLFLSGHIVRHDGDVSVRRGFRPDELMLLAAGFPHFRWQVRRRFAFRLCLVGRRV